MSLSNDSYNTAIPVPAAPAPVRFVRTSFVRASVPVPPAPEDSETVTRIIFTNQLLPDVYVLLRQYEHHSGAELRDIFYAALREYLMPKPKAHQPLPPARAAKLQERLLKK